MSTAGDREISFLRMFFRVLRLILRSELSF
jgi:hypothetical protein